MAAPPRPASKARPLKAVEAPAAPEPEEVPAQAPAAPHRYVAGDQINGKYVLRSVLGEGGMGAVWLATNSVLDVDVAIKLIRREMASHEAAERLLQEARAAARLGHPSIVRVYDFGETERGDPFIVMEVLAGESLGDVLDRKARLPAVAVIRTLLPIASALCAAHDKGIVHRDLKPENVVLVPGDGGAITPKLVDFGIAKLRHGDMDRTKTQTGTLLGSPDYMSPEQARGRGEVDQRSDVWAFTVVTYEALTGRRPFDGDNYNALLTAILSDEPTPIVDYAAGDPQLWAILKRGLAKDPADRWQDMREIGGALAAWAIGQGVEDDVAGTSLTSHWMNLGPGHPLSEAPPPSRAAPVSGRGADEAAPGAASTRRGSGRSSITEAPSSAPVPLAPSPVWQPAGAPPRRGARLAWAAAILLAGGAVAAYVTMRPAIPTWLSPRPAPAAPAAIDPAPSPPATAAPAATTTTAPAPTATATAAEIAAPPDPGSSAAPGPATVRGSAGPEAAAPRVGPSPTIPATPAPRAPPRPRPPGGGMPMPADPNF